MRDLELDLTGRPDEQPIVTRRELARALRCNPQTVAKWVDEGMPVAIRGRGGRPSKYDLLACQAWKEARETVVNGVTPVDLIRERARKERAQARLAEQLYAVREGKLLEADVAMKAWAAEIAGARAVILSSYTASADRVYRAATTDGLAGAERALKAIAYEVLRELSGGKPTAKRRKARKRP